MSSSALLKTSLVKKYWMAATGLFLCLFLLGHLAGNLQLFMTSEEGLLQFNAYAKFMTGNPVVKLLSYLTYFSILFHSVDGIMLARQNRLARPVNYAMNKPGANSSWASRKMALLGIFLLAFIVIHMKSFWYEMHFGNLPLDSAGNKDLYTITIAAFQQGWFTFMYVFFMIMLALHLSHGFQSAFQTLGINHPRYTPIVKKLGLGYAYLIPALFAAIPLYIFFSNL